ncbi:hypothetical protein B1B_14236, partial [mine drainage metagenome]
ERAGNSKPANAPPGSVERNAALADSKSVHAPRGLAALDQAAVDSKPANAPTGSEGLSAGAESSIPAAAFSRRDGTGQAECRGPGRPSAAAPWRAVILEKLQQGLEAQRIYQDLTAPEHGYRGTYYSVRRLAAKLSEYTELPVRRMECAAGVEAQVDFGRGAWLVDA